METKEPFVSCRELDTLICDFCTEAPVVKVYDCPDLTVPGHEVGVDLVTYQGAWAACGVCARLIDADDQEGISRRGLVALTEEYQRKHGLGLHPGTIENTRAVYRLFFARRNQQAAGRREA